jgi:inosine-uridine nucleoside N-ribohydrolase
MPRAILLDTDTGVDDALAICLGLRSPELRVVGITAVHGNVPVRRALANILRTLDVLRPDDPPPVALGADRPLVRAPVHAQDVHGSDGLGGATRLAGPDGGLLYPESSRAPDARHATGVLLDAIGEQPGEVTLVAVGPLTNVALALQRDPERMRQVRGLVVMGGAFRRQGNMSPVAEFNVFCDPHAAQAVLDSRLPLTLIPLDVSERVVLSRAMVERPGPVAQFVRDITREYMDFGERVEHIPGCYVHDALTVAYLLDPTLFRTVERYVAVETEGRITAGQTVADLREPPRFGGAPNARIAVDVDAEGFLRLFASRVLQAAQ